MGKELNKKPQDLHCKMILELHILPWLVWLSGLSAGLRTKGSLVRFPVRAHA